MVTLPVWFAFLQIILSIALAMYQVWNSRNKK